MRELPAEPPSRPKIRPIAVVAAIAGVLLFIYTLQAAGPGEILRQLRQIGAGFIVVLALSTIRMAVRAKAWSLCVEDSEHFTFGQAFTAYITGDAVGNVLPLGPLASEGTKALLSRRIISTSAAFSSVVLENVFYSLSVAIMVMVGTLAFLLGYRPTNAALTITLSLAAVAIVSVVAVWWLLRSQPRLLGRFLKHEAVRDAEDRVFRFAATRQERVGQILMLQFAFHRRVGSGDLLPAATADRPHRANLADGDRSGHGRAPHHDCVQVRAPAAGRRSRRIGIDCGNSRDWRAGRRDDCDRPDRAQSLLGRGRIGDAGAHYAKKRACRNQQALTVACDYRLRTPIDYFASAASSPGPA